MIDYYCPNCGANIGDQQGFDSDVGYWTCTECGQFLSDPEDFDDNSQFNDVSWFCDRCGAYLNKQSGFSDWLDTWTCTECGYTNNISEDEICESEEDYQRHMEEKNEEDEEEDEEENEDVDEDEEDEEEEDEENEDEVDEDEEDEEEDEDEDEEDEEWARERAIQEELRQEELRKKEQKEQERKDRRKARWKRVWSAIAHKKLIDVNINASDCIGNNYLQVVPIFEKNGFSKIRLNILEDLEYSDISKENEVSKITIDGNNFFDLDTKAKYDADIVITVHKLKKAFPPVAPKQLKGKHGKNVAQQFRMAGFVNVDEIIIRDLTFGWLKKDGQIDSVMIDDDNRYEADTPFRIDAKVVVTFHTFKKDKP